ncbi:MAG: PQQ-binding-like beta-propeller repeat protein [Gammaproteobacteria bacterium]|jgi:outer membrane protein assembly factor BamB|nr:PQQ-binding-like beta-propeller repeat protein [Gammaproteobacteria bacterium]
MRTIIKIGLLIGCIACNWAFAGPASWQQLLSEESTWSRVTFAGPLLVATENNLAHYASDSGEQLWIREDMNRLAQFNVSTVPGSPFLILNEHVSSTPAKSRLQVLNLMSGETIWDTGVLLGNSLGIYPAPENNLLVFIIEQPGGTGMKQGVYVVGFSVDDGEEAWRTRLGSMGDLRLHTSETSGFIPVQDLSGHPPPIVLPETIILPAGDLIAISLADGSLKWRFKLNAWVANLKLSYAQPLLIDGTLYAVGKKNMHAIDLETGTEKWQVKIDSAPMPQLEAVGDTIVGRMGGSFSNGKNLTQQKPFGAFAVDRNTGSLKWKWTKGKKSITNLRVMEDKGLIMLADKDQLYALDLNAEKKGKVVYQEKLEFKRKMGASDIAAKGMGAVGGFLGGGLAGGFQGLASGGDRGDPPLDIETYDDQLIIRAQYHVLAHNTVNRRTDWSIEFAPPGVSDMALIAMGAVTATMVMGNAGMSRSTGMSSNPYLKSIYSMSGSFQDVVAKRFAAAEKSRNLAFFLTQEESGMALVGIDLADGSEVGKIPMDEKEPQFMVDAIGSRVYYFKGNKNIEAYDF